VNLWLIEDSPGDIFLIKKIMEAEGLDFHLEVAEDGEEAFRIIDQLDAGVPNGNGEALLADIVLLDLNVPRRDGSQVLERLRQSPRLRDVPVVVISSSDSPADRRGALDLGATEYFRKPSTLAEFMKLGALVRRLYEERVLARKNAN
jgi:CheY-like chemotaxis protein